MGAVVQLRAEATDYINDTFGENGLLSRAVFGYEMRPGQVALARAVDRVCRDGGLALLEGPCGTGKSQAYLVPLIHHALATKTRAVIATASIALQEQLVQRELPALRRVMPEAFEWALIKGRGNFVCNERRAEGRDLDGADRKDFERIRAWSLTTKTGDKADLPFVPSDRVWSRFNLADSDDCKGRDCPSRDACFAARANADAVNANVLVVNYHVLFAHLALVADGAPGLLPAFDMLVCDEGHEIADCARGFFGATIRKGLFSRAAKFYRTLSQHSFKQPAVRDDADSRARAAEVLGDAWASKLRALVGDEGSIHLDEPPTTLPLTNVFDLVTDVAVSSKRMLDDLDARDEVVGLDRQSKEHRAVARSTARKFRKLEGWVKALTRLDEKQDVATWATQDAIEMRPIDMGTLLESKLWSVVRSVAITSATLAVGKSFDFIEREIGVKPTVRLAVESPFDFSRVMVVVPDVPPPSTEGWTDACASVVRSLVQAADGRTLALFSSRAQRDAVFAQMPRSGRQWLMQGDMSTRALTTAFRQDPRSVLFGTKSFWTGIDVPGDSCVAVMLDRIPFPQPSDPIVRKIHARLGDDAFRKYDLPRALMTLRQGFGRLMRRTSDYGVVVVTDSRVLSRRWGASVWDCLPKVVRGRSIADAAQHLAAFLEVSRGS